jgi:putative colanic acid biosynthesis acetyltransferase WcaF
MFGAKIGKGAVVYSSASIWAPWNLIMGDFASIADNVICYNVDKVSIGSHTTISQYTYLCTASHNIEDLNNALVTAPIFIKSQAWVAAGAYVNMGVTIGEGAVVGARACVFKNVESWTIVGGNPAVVIKQRTI